jgi:hypothetical protein
MAATYGVDNPLGPDRDQGATAPSPSTLAVSTLLAAILLLILSPAVIAAGSIFDSHDLDRFYQAQSAWVGVIIHWLHLLIQGGLAVAVWRFTRGGPAAGSA